MMNSIFVLVGMSAVFGPPVNKPVDAKAVVIRADGLGLPPRGMHGARARLMARRAAEVRAVRNWAFKAGYARNQHVRGFRYAEVKYAKDGSVRVTVEGTRNRRSSARRRPFIRTRIIRRTYRVVR